MNKPLLFVSLSVAAVVSALSPSAHADDTAKVAAETPAAPSEVQAEMGIFGFGSKLSFDNTLHSVEGGTPTPLKSAGLHFVGQGWMPGAEVRISVMPRDRFGRARIGFGVGAGGATGFHVASNPLTSGVSYQASSFWGARFEGFLGQEFAIGRESDILAPGRRAWLYPYIDLMAVGTITQATIDLHVAKLGTVGSSTWDAYAFSLAPRVGVAIPLSDFVSLDVGGYKGVYGAEKYGAYGGITIVTP